MRTTLKRGVGRGAEANGNGYGAVPPVVLTPVSHYRQPRRRGGIPALIGRILFVLLAAITSLAIGIAGGYWLDGEQTVVDIDRASRKDPQIRKAAQKLDIALPGRPAIAIVVGQDFRKWAKDESERGGRADTVMVIRADPNVGTMSTLSFPRDLMVDIHCPGRTPYTAPINSAYAICGLQGTVETVKQLTGLPAHYLITIDYRGFIQTVDKMGGVWIDVDRRYFNDNSGGGPTFPPIDLQPGYQQVSGRAALSYVRYRHTDSDLYRIERQRLFMRALSERVSSAFRITSPGTIPKLTKIARDNIRIAKGAEKALDPDEFRAWAFFALQLPPGRIFQSKIGGFYGSGTEGDPLRTDPSNIQAAIEEFQSPDVVAGEKATAAALGQRPRLPGAKAPPPGRTSMVVLNGNGVTGSAANASYLLGQRGYRTLPPPEGVLANAPPPNRFKTEIYFDPRQRSSQAAAKAVRNLFGSAIVKGPITPELAGFANTAMLVVIVGTTFHNNLAPAPVDRTPKRQPPNTIRNPDLTRPQLRAIRHRVDFPLMVPTQVERSSTLHFENPVRVYAMKKGERAVRLTFRTGAQEYWGIQQTSWEDAPVLESKNVSRRIGNRNYDLYYDGSRLHMVALKTNKGNYWVVNTLRDTLSNETMIAIARGLQPIGGKR
ncbi:MAG TPA: LCP family protein [Gaiellaceae bacterium]|jgi:LCP family protein required for cell wall assembly|nr:LCP family protein [Gaiellaceae bacterium]